jgi:hypothetical protein
MVALPWTPVGPSCEDPDVSTDVDTPVARRSRFVWLAVLLVVALGALLALNRFGAFGSDTPPGAAGQPDGFQAQLAAKVVNVLETLPAEEHGHNHDAASGESTMVCGVRIFGTNPQDADTLDEVAQVYGYHLCAVAQSGVEWIMSVKLSGPMVATLAADPPQVAVAEGGEGFQDRVNAIIPERYRAEARNENLTEEGMRELIRRYDEAAEA